MAEGIGHIKEGLDIAVSGMQFGIITVREFSEFSQLHLPRLVEEFMNMGCQEQNIIVQSVPTLFDVVATTHFLAEYTDVDGIVILVPENRMMSAIPILNGVVQLQVQWNMPITVGGAERAEHIVEMVTIQGNLAAEAAERASRGAIS